MKRNLKEDFRYVGNPADYIKQNNIQMRQARKYARINAVQAKGGEKIHTIASDGVDERDSIARPGDWIANNVGNPENKWIIRADKFEKKYQPDPTEEGVYIPKGGPMLAGQVSEPISFDTCGERTNIDKGGYLMQTPGSEDDIYGISGADFDSTYRFDENRKCAKKNINEWTAADFKLRGDESDEAGEKRRQAAHKMSRGASPKGLKGAKSNSKADISWNKAFMKSANKRGESLMQKITNRGAYNLEDGDDYGDDYGKVLNNPYGHEIHESRKRTKKNINEWTDADFREPHDESEESSAHRRQLAHKMSRGLSPKGLKGKTSNSKTDASWNKAFMKLANERGESLMQKITNRGAENLQMGNCGKNFGKVLNHPNGLEMHESRKLSESMLHKIISEAIADTLRQGFETLVDGFPTREGQPQSVEDVFAGDGWKILKVQQSTKHPGRMLYAVSRMTGAFGSFNGVEVEEMIDELSGFGKAKYLGKYPGKPHIEVFALDK